MFNKYKAGHSLFHTQADYDVETKGRPTGRTVNDPKVFK